MVINYLLYDIIYIYITLVQITIWTNKVQITMRILMIYHWTTTTLIIMVLLLLLVLEVLFNLIWRPYLRTIKRFYKTNRRSSRNWKNLKNLPTRRNKLYNTLFFQYLVILHNTYTINTYIFRHCNLSISKVKRTNGQFLLFLFKTTIVHIFLEIINQLIEIFLFIYGL